MSTTSPPARDYLELLLPPTIVERSPLHCGKRRLHQEVQRPSSGEWPWMIEADNHRVAGDLHKIHNKIALSPVLSVRGMS